MNYSEPLISQVTVFFRAVGCGIILGAAYSVFCAVRMLFGERRGVYIFFDTAYCLLCSLVSFFFMVIFNSGQVRLNLMLAELAGGAAFHFSLGKYALKRYERRLSGIRRVVRIILSPFVKTAGRVYTFLTGLRTLAAKRIRERKNTEKNIKKFAHIGKNPLKNKNKSV